MPITRREFLAGAGGLAGAAVFGVTGPAFGAARVDPRSAARNRLVVVFLDGGNDGLNFVVPRGDVPGAPRLSVYRRVRPTLSYKPGDLRPLDRRDDADQLMGLNPSLTHLHSLYRDGRVAIVQGVDYPNHNYSHFASTDIWHTGNTTTGSAGGAGWLGRHLDRVGVGEGELRAAAISPRLPLMLRGRVPAGSMTSIAAMKFRDGVSPIALDRHRALAAMSTGRASDPVRQRVGASLRQTVDIVEDLAKVEPPKETASDLTNSLTTARILLEQNLGVECVYVSQTGYDTHAAQRPTQERLLGELDAALEVFWATLRPDVADRTLVMIVSEFGRRVGETGRGTAFAGTDHGAAAPVVLVGPPVGAGANGTALAGGLHGDHPPMGTTNAPADNLAMTTDLRRLYQSVLDSWLRDPDPAFTQARKAPLPGLFTTASAAGAPAGKHRSAITSGTALHRADAATSTSSARFPRDRAQVASRHTNRTLGLDGRVVHPVTVAAAIAFNAFAAAVVLRSGRFREALAGWRDDAKS